MVEIFHLSLWVKYLDLKAVKEFYFISKFDPMITDFSKIRRCQLNGTLSLKIIEISKDLSDSVKRILNPVLEFFYVKFEKGVQSPLES